MSVYIINRVISTGDSLSDRGKMYKRLLFGIIPLAKLSGLEGSSPFGRFSNQYTWLDHWTAVLSESTYIKNLEAQGYTPENIMQLLLTNEEAKDAFHKSFNLDDNAHVRYYGQEAFNTYCEGGATASDWSGVFTWNIARNATRKIVDTLEKQRILFLAEEEAKCVTQDEKDHTLNTLFIGANDLITVNDPSALSEEEKNEVIKKAVTAQMEHIQALINAGYSIFSLTNLPNLGLTPRFQNNNWGNIGTELTQNYNTKLKEAYENLKVKNKDNKKLQLNFHDIHSMFNEVYDNPEKYGFDKDKLTHYFKDSDEFKENPKHGGGYLFWDEVHPTSKMANELEKMIAKKMAYNKLYDYTFVADTPTPILDFKVVTVIGDDLAQIENEVELDHNKVIFVKNGEKWSCYRYEEDKVLNHYVAAEHSQILNELLPKLNQFTPEQQFNLMTMSQRQHWNHGIYFYQDSRDVKALVIHKPYIPCKINFGKNILADNHYSLRFDNGLKLWQLSYFPSEVKGKDKIIGIGKINGLAELLKGKSELNNSDEANISKIIDDFHRKNCFEEINLTEYLHQNPNIEVENDLRRITKGKGSVIPCDETVKLIASQCQGPHDLGNHYIIEPPSPGFHLQYRDKSPTAEDKKMVEARRGTNVLVYFKGDTLTIGFCGKHGYLEKGLDKFANIQLIEAIDPLKFDPPQTQCTLEKTANLSKYPELIKDDSSPADSPFEILNAMIKESGGYGYDEASLMLDFTKAYKERWTEETFSAFFGSFFMKSKINPATANLERILRHALKDGGERTRSVLVDLGWIDGKNNLQNPFDKIEAIQNAYDIVKPEKSAEALITYAHFRR